MTITMGALSAFMAYFIVSIVTTKTFNEIDLVEVLNSQLDRPSREQNCPQEWKYYNGYCYKHVNESVTYSEAKQGCRANDAFVVDIQTYYEAEFVHNNVLPKNWIWVWIGLTDALEEGVWRWERTGQIATYTYVHGVEICTKLYKMMSLII